MKTVWRSREREALQAGLLKSTVNLPDLVLRFLRAREIPDSQIEGLFQAKLQDLTDPFSMKGMREAVDRLIEAFRRQEKVCIYADFDLDGTSGLALFWEGLETLGFENLVGYQPKRLSEGYGFHASAVEELAASGVKVIVTIDVGITAFAATSRAKELGIDVVLTDHHLPLDRKPEVYSLVNPNQGDCPSGLGYLCGAGVAFYLLRALKRGLVDAKLVEETTLPLKGLLDFLTIATLTDMVPLVSDNRVLVKQGLNVLSQTQRPGMKALLQELGLYGKALSSQDVAIKFAPKLNALSRMETDLMPIDLYRAENTIAAEQMVGSVLENNSARVERQSQGETKAHEILLNWPHDQFVFVSHEDFHRGVVGLIATKLSQQKNVPAFVGSRGADGMVVGSARTPQAAGLNLLDALGAVSPYLTRFGGHSGAAGFECRMDHLEEVIAGMSKFFSEWKSGPGERVVDFDLEVQLEDLTPSTMKWFEHLGPYGQGFAQPLFCLSHVRIKDSKTLRGGHRKVWIESPTTARTLEALYFSPPADMGDDAFQKGKIVSLLGEMQWNDFAGQRNLQFLIRELKPSSLEVTSQAERGVEL